MRKDLLNGPSTSCPATFVKSEISFTDRLLFSLDSHCHSNCFHIRTMSGKDVPPQRNDPRPDFSQPPPPKKLPASIQETLNNEESLSQLYYDTKDFDSTDNNSRYAAYAARARTILRSAHRYVAYTSDVGESFRPIAHPWLVRGAYGISWAYLAGDVGYEGYKAWVRNQRILHPERAVRTPPEAKVRQTKQVAANVESAAKDLGQPIGAPAKIPAIDDYRMIMAERAVFQSIASMGLPAFTIHSVVRYSGRWLKNSKMPRVRTWGPIGLGLAVVPALPFIFDEPVEKGTKWIFHTAVESLGGPEAVGRGLEGKKEL